MHLVSERGICVGVLPDALAQLGAALADPEFTCESILLAVGEAPEPGQDGVFVPAFAYGIQPGRLRPDGTMDFLDRELLKPVQQGETLGALHPPRPGRDGQTVTGQHVAARAGEPAQIELGEGVRLHDDGAVCAMRAGVVQYVAGRKLDVVQKHEHAGDVDLHSGHLSMEGSLAVGKSVLRPFRVVASGDVDVLGGVDGGSVQAGGSVRVRGRVLGGEAASLVAGGDVALRSAERARVVCGGSLQLENAVNSELSAEQIQVFGRLHGGTTRAERGVEAREVIAPRAGDTLVAAGVPLERSLFEIRRVLDIAKQHRGLRARPFGADARDSARGNKGKTERAHAALAREELEHRVALAARRAKLLPLAYVEVRETLHAGVTIQIGAALLNVERAMTQVRFRLDPETRQIHLERLSS